MILGCHILTVSALTYKVGPWISAALHSRQLCQPMKFSQNLKPLSSQRPYQVAQIFDQLPLGRQAELTLFFLQSACRPWSQLYEACTSRGYFLSTCTVMCCSCCWRCCLHQLLTRQFHPYRTQNHGRAASDSI